QLCRLVACQIHRSAYEIPDVVGHLHGERVVDIARENEDWLFDGIRIIHEEETDRWTGKRERSEKVGELAMGELTKRFLLNSAPR
ncbi:MAG: hypothetical protein ACI8P0_005548, partial [Planctomycetaceae bacterium]